MLATKSMAGTIDSNADTILKARHSSQIHFQQDIRPQANKIFWETNETSTNIR